MVLMQHDIVLATQEVVEVTYDCFSVPLCSSLLAARCSLLAAGFYVMRVRVCDGPIRFDSIGIGIGIGIGTGQSQAQAERRRWRWRCECEQFEC